MMRKPGDLLGVVWVGIFRRKRPVRRGGPHEGAGFVVRL